MGAKSCKVLLVDDSEDDRALFKLAFRRANTPMQLVWALCDGEHAIAYLSGTGLYSDRGRYPYPELLVLDLKMPGKSGFDVLEWLGRQTKRPLIIVLSGSDHRPDIERALSLGAACYQVKPPSLTDWIGTIKVLHDFWERQVRGT